MPLLLAGTFLILLMVIGGASILLLTFPGKKPVKVKANTVLRLNVGGLIPEYEPPSPFQAFMEKQPVHFHALVRGIERAASDPKVEGILLQLGPSNLGWAQAEEMRDVLAAFRAKGKWIVAFGELWQEREYYLASAADEIYMVPEGVLLLDGFMSRTSFYAELLEKFGVRVHVEAFGEYKSFADAYRRTEMSEANRVAMTALLEGLESTFLDAVHDGRGIEVEDLRGMINTGIFDPTTGVAEGLLDGLRYQDEVETGLAEKLGLNDDARPHFVSAGSYALSNGVLGFGGGPSIAVIYARGSIQSGSQRKGFFGDDVVASADFIRQLEAARENDNVKAIVLRVDSPGGSHLASDVMWREIQRTRTEFKKPVIASMGTVAASGGYYMAMACDEIVAQPTTITGSIGVVTMRVDFQQLYEKILVNVEVLKTADSADFFDPHRPLTDAEIEGFRTRTRQAYESFVQKAADSRKQMFDTLEPNARGRVWLGRDAQERQLVDHLGGLDRAVEIAADKAGLDSYAVINYPLQDDYWSFLQGQGVQTRAQVFRDILPREVRLVWDLFAGKTDGQWQTLALMPFQVDIQ